jgi:hypothetical protein
MYLMMYQYASYSIVVLAVVLNLSSLFSFCRQIGRSNAFTAECRIFLPWLYNKLQLYKEIDSISGICTKFNLTASSKGSIKLTFRYGNEITRRPDEVVQFWVP